MTENLGVETFRVVSTLADPVESRGGDPQIGLDRTNFVSVFLRLARSQNEYFGPGGRHRFAVGLDWDWHRQRARVQREPSGSRSIRRRPGRRAIGRRLLRCAPARTACQPAAVGIH